MFLFLVRDADDAGILKSKHACEGDVATIGCHNNTVMDVRSLFYGRSSDHGDEICSNGAPQTPCEMTGFDKTVCKVLLYGRPVRVKMEQSDWFSERSESCSPHRVTGPICF
jgi:hypothetical protein